MKYTIILFLFIAVIAAGCKTDNELTPPEYVYLKAVVIDTYNSDCHRPVLDFTEDSAAARNIGGQTLANFFVIKGLPAELNVRGNRLYVAARKIKPEEAFACTMQHPTFSAMVSDDAKLRE